MRLIAEALTRVYGDRRVLDGVDLELRPGQSVAITGPSGSGKTTLLGLCGGLVRPTGGTVTVEDDDGRRSPPDEHVGYVLQTVNVLPRRTALDNAALGALHDGTSWPDALDLAREALPRVGLGGLEDRIARSLSGGELQRVVIARALVGRHPFVLADEPTGQLDRSTSRDVTRTLLEASRDSCLVVVTHDEEVARSCEIVLRIDDGHLVPA
ncbi:ABC transporter ATP-binding protein [Sanguibacter antarcticus]|uniref:Putative ABC transport system ATP-binding protein/lipoprotein-releasing system ATP-binding protein n=1 Tax=Sanguibacter antarcticus TaxID=372484 RepID=A0A2A9E8V1_9MICO|nr:ATP-binding cassette domain-containing protein [Sanguibacter antarcticus]PFG34649.1 putative ABC transport system ATP-binding protein/lipoprotein-releasing system ATP-binding protein [Sanguibacter antarcticus]